MKKCKDCQYYTDEQCHGHNEYYGLCLKKKERTRVTDDTICLHDIKTLRAGYWEQKALADKLKYQLDELKFYKLRYESKCRTVEKIQDLTLIACKYIAKENLPKWRKENLDYLMKYKIPFEEIERVISYDESKQN